MSKVARTKLVSEASEYFTTYSGLLLNKTVTIRKPNSPDCDQISLYLSLVPGVKYWH